MTKHIIGLALFSFIVGVSAIVYALFNVPEIVPVYEVINISAPQYAPVKRTGCKMNRASKINAIEIKQAVLDLQTKQFSWELATPDIDEQIALHFFSKDSSGTRYITTEYINNTFSYNGILRYSSSYNWLNKRKSHENLYVTAQFESELTNYNEPHQYHINTSQPKFDARKATAVTIDYGK